MIQMKAIEVEKELDETNFSGSINWCDSLMKRQALSVRRNLHFVEDA